MQTYTFVNPETNKTEQINKEKWRWEAHYTDGIVLKQFDDNGVFHPFVEINQQKLAVFKMVSDEVPYPYTLLFSPGEMKLIHFYKRIVLNALTKEEKRITLYIVGFEKNIFGRTTKLFMVITPENELVVTDQLERIVVKEANG